MHREQDHYTVLFLFCGVEILGLQVTGYGIERIVEKDGTDNKSKLCTSGKGN